jgi:N utilization substance protein A
MKIVIDSQAMQTITLFERMTHAEVKDCIMGEEQVIFIVNEGEAAKAIGKGGQHVRTLENKLKKRVKVVEFHPDLLHFVKNLVAPLKLSDAKFENEKVLLSAKDLKTRGMLIGRGASNLRQFESIVKRYFTIDEIRVE